MNNLATCKEWTQEIPEFNGKTGLSEWAEKMLRIQRDLAVALSAVRGLNEGLNLCLEAAFQASDMDCGGIYLFNKTAEDLELIFHKGLSPDFVKSVSSYNSDSANTRIVRSGKPVYSQHQKLGVLLDETKRKEKLRAVAVLPIHHRNQMIGSLNVASHTHDEVPVFSRMVLETISSTIGSAVARLKAEEALQNVYHDLEQKVQERTAELKKTNEKLQREIEERTKTEQALRVSEKRYRLLTEHVADGVAIFQDGKIQIANPAFASIFGYPADQLVEMDPIVLFHDDHRERFRELVEKPGKGIHAGPFQYRCTRGDGRNIWTEGHPNLIEWTGRPAVLVTIRDITESRQREQVLSEEREYFRNENIKLNASLKDRYRLGGIIGKSPAMQKIYELILNASAIEENVIIYGESGTGKELVAGAIHALSDRKKGSLVPVNCGAIPENLLESEFFGYKKGAFTGATIDKHGFLDLADGGSLFLDELGEIGLNMQVKLLRALDGSGYTPLGANEVKKPDVRIIAATNRDIKERVKKGLMREDFFYRIHIIPIHLPPLRERKEDIPLLIEHFLKKFGDDKTRPPVTGKVMEALYNYDWPGNVRELQNTLYRYITLNRLDFIGVSNIPSYEPKKDLYGDPESEGQTLNALLENFE